MGHVSFRECIYIYNKMVVAGWTSQVIISPTETPPDPGAVTTGCTQMEVGCRPSGQGWQLIGFGKNGGKIGGWK